MINLWLRMAVAMTAVVGTLSPGHAAGVSPFDGDASSGEGIIIGPRGAARAAVPEIGAVVEETSTRNGTAVTAGNAAGGVKPSPYEYLYSYGKMLLAVPDPSWAARQPLQSKPCRQTEPIKFRISLIDRPITTDDARSHSNYGANLDTTTISIILKWLNGQDLGDTLEVCLDLGANIPTDDEADRAMRSDISIMENIRRGNRTVSGMQSWIKKTRESLIIEAYGLAAAQAKALSSRLSGEMDLVKRLAYSTGKILYFERPAPGLAFAASIDLWQYRLSRRSMNDRPYPFGPLAWPALLDDSQGPAGSIEDKVYDRQRVWGAGFLKAKAGDSLQGRLSHHPEAEARWGHGTLLGIHWSSLKSLDLNKITELAIYREGRLSPILQLTERVSDMAYERPGGYGFLLPTLPKGREYYVVVLGFADGNKIRTERIFIEYESTGHGRSPSLPIPPP